MAQPILGEDLSSVPSNPHQLADNPAPKHCTPLLPAACVFHTHLMPHTFEASLVYIGVRIATATQRDPVLKQHKAVSASQEGVPLCPLTPLRSKGVQKDGDITTLQL